MHNNRTTESLLFRRALAEKATPGPWKSVYDYCVLPNIYDDRPANVLIADCSREHDHDKKTKANALYIAANSPDVVMADIDEILRLREQVERLEKEADWLAEYCWKKPEAEYHPLREMRGGFYCGACPYDYDCRKCWREAARKAVEANHD